LAFLAAKRPKTTLVTFTLLSSAHTMHESTGVAIGGRALEARAYSASITQLLIKSAKNAPKTSFSHQKIHFFLGEGTQPLPQTSSPWGGDTPPYTSPFQCPHYN